MYDLRMHLDSSLPVATVVRILALILVIIVCSNVVAAQAQNGSRSQVI